jgi:purine-binding chemotaxis protein CheW
MIPGAGSYILFTIAGTSYAVRSDEVRHMDMVEEITPVPNAGPALEGVVFSRGQIVPVLSLRARFGFPKTRHDSATRLIVVQAGERWVGLVVDSAREFVRIPADAIQPPGHAVGGLSADYLEGVARLGDRLVLVLNVAGVLDVSSLPAEADAAASGSIRSAGTPARPADALT